MTEPRLLRRGAPTDTDATPLAAVAAHAEIRDRILSGELAGGTVISQVGLAAELGISRTPLREALRMLQEEGLVEAEPNRQCRIAGFDAVDLDATYGTRLMLEALGMRVTLPRLAAHSLQRAAELLDDLERLGGPAAGETWHRVHHEFHQTFVSGASQPLIDQIRSFAKRTERYMYLDARSPSAGGAARPAEHRHVLQHVVDGQLDDAIVMTARHLARTPLMLLAEIASEVEPVAIRAALSMVAALKPDPMSEGRSRRRSA